MDLDDEAAEESSGEAVVDVEPPESADNSSKSTERQHVLPFDQLDSLSTEEEATAPEQPDERSGKQKTIDTIVSLGSEIWLRLSHWGKVSDLLEPRERSLSYGVGDRIRREIEPSFAQARWARTILLEAIETGFDVSGADGQKGEG